LEHVISGERRSSALREEEANRVLPTSQSANLLALFLGKAMLVLICEMTSYLLGACPDVIAEWTLWLDRMLVCHMPLKLLESSVSFVAIATTAEPLFGTSSTIFDTLRAPHFRDLPRIRKSYSFGNLILMVPAKKR
jgi:hypothetical protein